MRKGGDQEGAGEPAAETAPLGSPIRMDGREAGLELEGYFGLRKFVFHLLFKTGDKNACFNADEDATLTSSQGNDEDQRRPHEQM